MSSQQQANMQHLVLFVLLCLAAAEPLIVASVHDRALRVPPQILYNRLPAAASAAAGMDISGRFAANVAMPRLWQSSNLISGNPQSICTACYCHMNMVVCDYARNHTLSNVLNNAYIVPSNVTSMELKLDGRTRLELHNGFFQNNRVNRFIVQGAEDGNDQVELAQDAFRGNQGGYPDIQIRQVPEVFVRSHAFSAGEIKFRVEHCSELVLFPNAFINMNMSSSFSYIGKLKIDEKAFSPSMDRSSKAQVRLRIEHAYIENLYSFEVSMHEIRFVNCTIGAIRRQAFDVTNINDLIFENCRIDTIEGQAFTSKLHSDHVSITGAIIGNIDSEAIMGSGISALTIRNNSIKKIKAHAITVFSVYVYIQNNNINQLGHHWLQIKNGEHIAIEHNRFGDFAAMELEESRNSNCSFAHNWVAHPEASSLNFTKCEVHHINVERACGCETDWVATLTNHDLSSELYCRLGQRLQYCFNETSVHMRRYINEACGENRNTLRCIDKSIMKKVNGEFYSKEELAMKSPGKSIFSLLRWILIVAITFVIVIIVFGIFYYYRCQKPQVQGCFRDDECDIIRRELFQLKHRKLKKLLNKLINVKLTAEQCQELITRIMQIAPELPKDIDKVLSDHLLNTAAHKEVSYAQPNCVSGVDMSSGGTNVATSPEIMPQSDGDDFYTTPVGSQPSAPEHIYSELQAPLLNNIYASPADPHLEAPEYAEPFNAQDLEDRPPAYEATPQYAMPQRQPQLPLSTSAVQAKTYRPQNASYATPIWHSDANVAATNAPALPLTQTQAKRHVSDLRQDIAAQLHSAHPLRPSPTSIQQQQQQSSYLRRPTAAASSRLGNGLNTFACRDGAASLAAMEHMDMRGAAALPSDTGSDHSGGSNETVKIDDVIDYVDA